MLKLQVNKLALQGTPVLMKHISFSRTRAKWLKARVNKTSPTGLNKVKSCGGNKSHEAINPKDLQKEQQ